MFATTIDPSGRGLRGISKPVAAPVAVEQHPGMLARMALEPGHAQRVDDDA